MALESMIFFGGLLALAYLVLLPIIAVIAWRRSGRLDVELQQLRRQVEELGQRPAAPVVVAPSAKTSVATPAAVPVNADLDLPDTALPVQAAPTPVRSADEVVASIPAASPQPVAAADVSATSAAAAATPEAGPARAGNIQMPADPPRRASARSAASARVAQPAQATQLSQAPAAAPRNTRAPAASTDSSPNPLSGLISWFMQGNPLAKLGVLLLFFGLAYLFKYAADRDMFPIELRLAGAGAIALGLLTIGWRLRLKVPLYALILQGGAVGALYLTCFAAFKLYALLPHAFVFALLIVICATSVALAVLQRAQSLAVLASLGGYLAPVLLSTGGGNHVALFSYYAMLSIGILAVSLWQSWRPLNLVGFFFSFGVGLAWGERSYTPDDYFVCQLFLVFNLLVYGVLAVVFALRHQGAGKGFIDGTLVFGTPLVGFGLQAGMTRHWEFGPAFSALAFAALYLPLARYLMRRWPQEAQRLYLSFLALGAGFATLAIPLALSAQWTALAWALEGLGVLWAGRTQHQPKMSWSGTALLLLAAGSAVIAWDDGMNTSSFLMISAALSLCWLAGSWWWREAKVAAADSETPDAVSPAQAASSLLLAGGIFAWLLLLAEGSDRLVTGDGSAAMLALACMGASALAWNAIGMRLTWDALRHCAWLLWPAAALALLGQIGNDGHVLASGAWSIVWLPTIAIALYLLRKPGAALSANFNIALHGSLVWGLLALFGSELLYRINRLGWATHEWRFSLTLAFCALAILIVWQLHRRVRWPVSAQPMAYWLWGLAPVLPVSLFLLVIGNMLDGVMPTLGYLPVINPLELSAAFALLMLTVWQRAAGELLPGLPRKAIQLGLWAIAVWWINGLLLRSLALVGDVAWDVDSLWNSRFIQTAFALAWTLAALACMQIAARRASRRAWFGGAALLGIVIAKLFLVDSARGGGLARAIAFIGVALLVLLIGYIAPLPPRHAGTDDKDTENTETEEIRS